MTPNTTRNKPKTNENTNRPQQPPKLDQERNELEKTIPPERKNDLVKQSIHQFTSRKRKISETTNQRR